MEEIIAKCAGMNKGVLKVGEEWSFFKRQEMIPMKLHFKLVAQAKQDAYIDSIKMVQHEELASTVMHLINSRIDELEKELQGGVED